MRNLSLSFIQRIAQGKLPFIYLVINTPMGDRVYSDRIPNMTSVVTGLVTHDGTEIVTHARIPLMAVITDYSFSAISVEDRVTSFGQLVKELVSKKVDLLASRGRKRKQSMTFALDNSDYAVTKAMAVEPFMNRRMELFAGFEDTPAAEHLQLFAGEIKRVTARDTKISIEVVEGRDMALDDTCYLPKSERYANPLRENDPLPLVYGDLTDGSQGVWKLPCVDKVNFVYAFSAHEVLSVANGNSVTIYADDVEVSGGNYTFDESNDYETKGVIATVMFTSDQKNAKITARGKGKPTTTGGATLMENVIDIIFDFLTVENSFSTAIFNTTSKSEASNKFDSQGYVAAGCVVKDETYWKIISSMIGSFLGSVTQDADGYLTFDIDDGSDPDIAGIFPSEELKVGSVVQRSENIVNRCPVDYRRNYAEREFSAVADESAFADTKSINSYGTRRPEKPFEAFWIRDLTSVRAVQTVVVSRQKEPTWEIDVDVLTANWLHLDPGDNIGISLDQLHDANGVAFSKRIAKIVSLRPELTSLKCRLTLHDTKTDYLEYLLKPLVTHDGAALVTHDGAALIAQVQE